ncbi:MAG: sulfur carrier protein ThiS [Oscillospiraceae bacterium]|nr:sulfur carrier protein ThiS [Oscillospiraceae bacterium]
MVIINGEAVNADGQTVAAYLAAAGYIPERVAVERNGAIVPRAQYAMTVLCDGDRVEIVCFVGGG